MGSNRKLRMAEKGLGILPTEHSRDLAHAKRQLEGLEQGDQVIALLSQINERLSWICEELYRQRPAGSGGSAAEAVEPDVGA